jgi:hypothetical protein
VLVEKEGYWYDGEWAMADLSQPSPPPAPNPQDIINASGEANRLNQFTPFGNLTFSGPGNNTANLQFDPQIQALFDQRLQSDQGLQALAQQFQQGVNPAGIDISGLNPLQQQASMEGVNFSGPDVSGVPGIPTDLQGFRNDVSQATFDRQNALLQPVFQDQQRHLEQQLANRGLPEFVEASDKAQSRFTQNRDRALIDAANAATIAGARQGNQDLAASLAASQTGFGQALGLNQAQNQASGLNFGVNQQQLQNQNNAINQSIGNQQAIGGNQIQQLLALLQGGQQTQVPGLQSFFAPGQTDVQGAFGLQQQALQNNFNTESQRANAGLGGLFGLGSAALLGPLSGGFSNPFAGLFGGNNMPGSIRSA